MRHYKKMFYEVIVCSWTTINFRMQWDNLLILSSMHTWPICLLFRSVISVIVRGNFVVMQQKSLLRIRSPVLFCGITRNGHPRKKVTSFQTSRSPLLRDSNRWGLLFHRGKLQHAQRSSHPGTNISFNQPKVIHLTRCIRKLDISMPTHLIKQQISWNCFAG